VNWHSQQIATFDRSARLANKSGRSYGSDEIDRSPFWFEVVVNPQLIYAI
jgi:hypothetical protein